MKHLRDLVHGLDVSSILAELEARPDLWNEYTLRTGGYVPVHNAVSDIWVRYRSWTEWLAIRAAWVNRARELKDAGNEVDELSAIQQFVGEPHESVWYPAITALPSLRELIFDLMHSFQVERLGGVLITRIPPGGEVKPHIDRGWHASYYEKIAVQLKSAPGQNFCFADGCFECEPGTVYAFDNSFQHWVENKSDQERITCIVCVRRDSALKPLSSGMGD